MVSCCLRTYNAALSDRPRLCGFGLGFVSTETDDETRHDLQQRVRPSSLRLRVCWVLTWFSQGCIVRCVGGHSATRVGSALAV